MIDPSEVTAIIVTRGDVDLTPILADLAPVGFHEILVWDNSGKLEIPVDVPGPWRIVKAAADIAVYGRYLAIEETASDVIYVQDDDCLCPAATLLEWYEPGKLVANMPESRWADYPDSCLVGWGAVFDRGLPFAAFEKIGFEQGSSPYIEDEWTDFAHHTFDGPTVKFPEPGPLRRECDVVFTTLTFPRKIVDLGFEHLPWAEDPERAMFLRPWRAAERDRMYELARKVRDHEGNA